MATNIKHVGPVSPLCGAFSGLTLTDVRVNTIQRTDMGLAWYRSAGKTSARRLRDEPSYRVCRNCIRVLKAQGWS